MDDYKTLTEAIYDHARAHGEITDAYKWCVKTAPISWLQKELARIEVALKAGDKPFNGHHVR